MQLINAVIDNGVDIIELDLVQKSVLGAAPVVGNAEGVSYHGLDFESVVENDLLTFAEQILFLEVKGEITSKNHIRNILSTLKNKKTNMVR